MTIENQVYLVFEYYFISRNDHIELQFPVIIAPFMIPYLYNITTPIPITTPI